MSGAMVKTYARSRTKNRSSGAVQKVFVEEGARGLYHDPIDGSPPGSPVPGILQARTLEWVAIPFSRGSSRPRYKPLDQHIIRFTISIY